jgi:phosphoribosylamine--glycine ligase
MSTYGVATAQYFLVRRNISLNDFYDTIHKRGNSVVLKYDGLAAGKGVLVCPDVNNMQNDIRDFHHTYSSRGDIIIEQLLSGYELSIIGITDGNDIVCFQPSQDHKRLLDNDEGPNTGGMGAYTPVKCCDQTLMEKINTRVIKPTLHGLQNEHFNYKGFIYFGVLVQDDIPYLLEYNVRMGDPETQTLMPSLESDLVETILAVFNNNLHAIHWEFHPKHYISISLVSGGYPNEYKTGYEISGLNMLAHEVQVFFSGVREDKYGKLLTNGGRVMNIVANGFDFHEARNLAYLEVEKIHYDGMYYRKDIGQRNL